MYSIVYVLVDDEKLTLYNEMMKSLISLRMRMPERPVTVLVDSDTERYMQRNNAGAFQLAEIVSVEISNEYSQVEKSRYIKTNVRRLISGDFLFIDTDTVICDEFPDKISDASIAMVLELHNPRSIAKCSVTDLYDEICGIEKSSSDLYYNSGVMWVKDDAVAHMFYDQWYRKWEETRKSGLHRDQPPLNYVVGKMESHVETLDGIWNVQISTGTYTPLQFLADSHIIHYMDNDWSCYQLCRPEYKSLNYNDEVIIEMLKHPRTLFERCRVLRLDDNNQFAEGALKEYETVKSSCQYRLLKKLRKHERIFQVFENILSCASRFHRIIATKPLSRKRKKVGD